MAAAERARGGGQALLSHPVAQSLRAAGQGVGGQDSASDSSLNGRLDLWRMAVPLTLVLMSSDLLAMNLRSSPETLEAVREIQLRSQKLLDFLRTSKLLRPSPPKPDQPEETPRETAGPLGTITPA